MTVGLASLGLLFVILFATSGRFRSGVPGYPKINDAYYWLMTNWNTDLREEFLWNGDTPKEIQRGPLAEQCKIAGFQDGLVQWQSPFGTFWLPAEEGVESLVDMAHVIQHDVYAHKGRTVRPGDVVLDCGAHVGSFTRKALDKGASLVVAIEPSSDKVACMRRTFAAEIVAGKVRVLQVGVWSKDDRL